MNIEFLARLRTISNALNEPVLKFTASSDNKFVLNQNNSDRLTIRINNGDEIRLVEKQEYFWNKDDFVVFNAINYGGCSATFETQIDEVEYISINTLHPIIPEANIKKIKNLYVPPKPPNGAHNYLFMLGDVTEYIGEGDMTDVPMIRCFECPNLTYIGLKNINHSISINKTNLNKETITILINNLGTAINNDTQLTLKSEQYSLLDDETINVLKSKNWNLEII